MLDISHWAEAPNLLEVLPHECACWGWGRGGGGLRSVCVVDFQRCVMGTTGELQVGPVVNIAPTSIHFGDCLQLWKLLPQAHIALRVIWELHSSCPVEFFVASKMLYSPNGIPLDGQILQVGYSSNM